MKKAILLLSCFSLLSYSYAQSLSSISGKVIDSKTKETLPGAVVYLANTTFGASADGDGSFELNDIPPGKYDLSVSMVGYKSLSEPIVFSGNSVTGYEIKLTKEFVVLNSVTVVAHLEKQKKSDYTKFARAFLGQTSNSRKCKILNPEDIIVYWEQHQLLAIASKPIVIENKALGYTIHYDLKEFSTNTMKGTITFSGVPRFEEMTPSSEREKRKWNRERDRAFYGSIQHFLLSLRQNELESNYFIIRNERGKSLGYKDLMMTDSTLYYFTRINLSFLKETPDINYHNYKALEQNSEITFTGAPIQIYSNGYYEDFHNLLFGGYIAWGSAVAELVPLGYHPTRKINSN